MKRQITHIVAGAGFVAGCCLMQGCVNNKGSNTNNEPVFWSEIPEEPQIEVRQEMPPVIAPVMTTTAYSVQKGDTITGIAVRYGLRWQDVVAVNPGISPNKLQVGQVIQLPGQVNLSRPTAVAPRPVAPAPTRAETVYVVKNGDTLSGIAQKHGVKTAAILEANDLKDANKIVVGQKLKIPGAVKSTATVAPITRTTAPRIDPPKPKPAEKDPVVTPVPAKADTETVTSLLDKPADTNNVNVTPASAPTTGKTHTVKIGEDIYTVAVRWGVSPSDLRALNNLTSADLQEGQVIIIPAGASAQ